MFTVALIGPDGVGKSTIARQLAETLPFRAKYVYMGVNLECSTVMLPTTRLILEIKRACGRRPDMAGPADPTRVTPRPRGLIRRVLHGVKSVARLINQVAEERFRQIVIGYHLLHRTVVLLDRDFFADYYAYDIDGSNGDRPLTRRIHGFMLRRFYRRPDLVMLLDAPGETLFARKHEGTPELLDRRRQDYLRLRDVLPHFQVVDATRALEQVVEDVQERICEFRRTCMERHSKNGSLETVARSVSEGSTSEGCAADKPSLTHRATVEQI
jgi:thymidylate kinase